VCALKEAQLATKNAFQLLATLFVMVQHTLWWVVQFSQLKTQLLRQSRFVLKWTQH
jgi:hypothetical protein